MAFTYRPTTTLSAALNDTDNEFNVASTTNISVGDLLVFKNEVMQVREIPVSGRVVVRRGYEGTHALSHKTGTTFYIGTGEEFERIRHSTLGLFGPSFKIPDICVPGARGFDANGYEYILVDCTATIIPGATVLISKDGLYTASVLTSAGAGNVGILIENATSAQWAWAIIKGYYSHAKLVGGSSLVTSTGVVAAASSVSTPAVGLRGATTSEAWSTLIASRLPVIMGMYPASAASTASTSATSETGLYCDVWLEYPFLPRKMSS